MQKDTVEIIKELHLSPCEDMLTDRQQIDLKIYLSEPTDWERVRLNLLTFLPFDKTANIKSKFRVHDSSQLINYLAAAAVTQGDVRKAIEMNVSDKTEE